MEWDLKIVYVKHKGALSISGVFVDASKLQVYISIILAIDSIWTAFGFYKDRWIIKNFDHG